LAELFEFTVVRVVRLPQRSK